MITVHGTNDLKGGESAMGLYVWLKRMYRAMFGRSVSLGVHPAGAVAVTLTAGAAWVYGVYVQLIAAVLQDEWITGVELTTISVPDSGEVAIALGVPGSEVDRVVLPFSRVQITAAGTLEGRYMTLKHPIFVPSGTRIAARVRTALGTTTADVKIVTATGM